MSDKIDLDFEKPEVQASGTRPARLWHGIIEGMSALGTVMIVLLMLVISADVVARNVFGASLPLVSELGALIVVMIVYLQLGAAIRADRMARAEMFFDWLNARSPRLGHLLNAVFHLLGGVMCAILAGSTMRILASDISHGEEIGVTGVFTMPVWPFRLLIVTGLVVAMLQFLFHALGALRASIAAPGKAIP